LFATFILVRPRKCRLDRVVDPPIYDAERVVRLVQPYIDLLIFGKAIGKDAAAEAILLCLHVARALQLHARQRRQQRKKRNNKSTVYESPNLIPDPVREQLRNGPSSVRVVLR